MPSKIIPTELTCKCGHKQIIKCVISRDYSQWQCRSCAISEKWSDPTYRANRPQKKQSTRSKQGSEEHKKKLSRSLTGRTLTDNHKAAISESVKKRWLDDNYRNKIISILNSEESKQYRKGKSEELWENEKFKNKYKTIEHKQKMRNISIALWKDDGYRNKIIAAKSTQEHKQLMRQIQKSPEYIKKLSIACAKLPRVSSIQKILYNILDDLNVEYYGEEHDAEKCVIGPWSFDCVIPSNDKTILIECNGDWVHSLPRKVVADKAKSTYVERYLSQTHTLKYLWEHQFASYHGILDLIKLWCGLNKTEQEKFDLSDVQIKRCYPDEYRQFLQSYHYLSNAGRGGIVFGGYLNDKLIAVIVFSPLPRQNISIGDFNYKETKDLSRLCIHPNYQKKNFGSWFVSRCIKLLDNNIKCVVSYADTTFNHNGTIYKAANFEFDGFTAPEYWYASKDGWVMHKKTLYNKAVNLRLKESEYAERFGLKKVHGFKKLRFIFKR